MNPPRVLLSPTLNPRANAGTKIRQVLQRLRRRVVAEVPKLLLLLLLDRRHLKVASTSLAASERRQAKKRPLGRKQSPR